MHDVPPANRADHAEDFSRRYADDLEIAAGQAMLDLGISPGKIGASDPDRGFRHAVFHPSERTGGSVTPDGRFTVDSGIMNPDLLTRDYDGDTVELWRLTRLGDRLQAIAIHEEAEGASGSHEEALAQAPLTQRPIRHAARELLKQMERGWTGS